MPGEADIVMEGGGVKGTALVGALAVLEARGYRYVNLAGTSAGAIVAALTAAGYSAEELREIMTSLDYTRFLDSGPYWLPRRSRAAYNLFRHWGIHRGDSFWDWMRARLADRGVWTFNDLKHTTPDKGQIYRLRVVASDVTRGRMLVLPDGIGHYGIDPGDLEVALAVRMSMSIPGFYRPVTLRNKDGNKSYIVDGGLLSNFPIQLFDGPGMDTRPTFGLRLTGTSEERVTKHPAHGLTSYFLSMFLTATEASYYQYIDSRDFIRTIAIDSLGVSSVDFGLSVIDKRRLYTEGVKATRAFLDDWDFEAWKKTYYEWLGVDRREMLWKQARESDARRKE